MERIIPLVIIGLFFYLLLFRRGGVGGMGCCGSPDSHDSDPHHDAPGGSPPQIGQHDVIDLQEGEYTVLLSGKGKEL